LRGVELALDLLDQLLVQVEQPAEEPDHEHQVLLAVRQLPRQLHTYEAALERTGLEPGWRVLDIGCGVGAFLQLVAERGAVPFGVDASEALVTFSRGRLPGASLRVGEMERLPWGDDVFDLVTGFNSFFFADDMVAGLREAGRVARPGAPVVIQVWGAHERCDLEAMKRVARPFLPPRPPDAPSDPDLSRPGALEALASEAGLTPENAFDVSWAYDYPDAETLGRALVAVAGLAVVVGPEREDELRKAIVDGLGPYRRADGSYRLQNEYRFLIARA
jgi:SAM-dependent methyltransferase